MAPKTSQDQPKTAPRGSWREPFSFLKIVSNFDSFCFRFWTILASQMAPRKRGRFSFLRSGSCSVFACYFCVVLDRFQDGPRGAQEAPRPPQEGPGGAQEAPRPPPRASKRLQEAAKSAPGGPKRSPRDLRSRSRGLKTLQDRPKSLQKNTVPKTIVHINVADIAEIDKDKTLLTRGAA